jgi:hypothetical protein
LDTILEAANASIILPRISTGPGAKMRKLSDDFMDCLQFGFLHGILQTVRDDYDLNLEIREGYLNIYFKGHSLLKLIEASSTRYKTQIHKKFTSGLNVPSELKNEKDAADFLSCVPHLKQNIIKHGKNALEIEYEQMIIRANNYEPRNNSEYFIVDRQYTVDIGRFDLTGFFWDRKRRRKNQEVDLCLMEVKFALNQDIKDVHQQLSRYYQALKSKAVQIAEENETLFRQKLELGLYSQAPDRLAAMKTLVFSRDFSRFQFILVLVDYTPNSTKFDLSNIASLPFADQVKVFSGGLAMWQQNVKPVIGLGSSD